MRPGLTHKQFRFVQEYVRDLNATEAAIRAGYKPKSASEVAGRLVKKSHVADAIVGNL
jgi:phage terminase small subunit